MSDMETSGLVALVELRRRLLNGSAKRIREANGLSTGDVARALDVETISVWRWERGVRTPRREVGVRYMELLNKLLEMLPADFED